MKKLFRLAVSGESESAWQLILQAKERMRLRGSEQWQDGYPKKQTIVNDIDQGFGYVMCFEDEIVAYGAVIFGEEPAYNAIEAGQWLSDFSYVVVHRLAVADGFLGRGIATQFMLNVEKLAREKGIKSFRVDTNFDNWAMQKIIEKQGFLYCGEVQYRGSARKAYEKLLE